jgi:hypothetical protein
VENIHRGSGHGVKSGCFESGDEPPGSMKVTELPQLIDCQLNKHDHAQFNVFMARIRKGRKQYTARPTRSGFVTLK